ncbi:hypothetical protein [Gracilinema caldarium]|uniref:Lipoprotein n=1 Tax=Gracilinema caldarium (strain ATCC 51460 / DSM 7334 / H1) TaxID=744872 RepID=F8F3K1_GRAC1|nr:hypothetical protein [Gracilinema caldarium]AEJ19945.1 hypothetical protein Spica_1807 [Gracilinema caldarium DSM 7334]
MNKKNNIVINLFWLFLSIFISCSSTEEQLLRKSYNDLCKAITMNNVTVIDDVAPFLLEEKNRQAFLALQELCNSHPSFHVTILDSKRAIIQLRDPAHTVLPFELDQSGRWLLKETFHQVYRIDFIPANN